MVDRQYIIPEWEGSVFQKWSKKFCADNVWRVRNTTGDYEDCLQECYMQYLYCRQHYPNVTANHFNYMFMLAVHNVFDTAATRDSNLRDAMSRMPKPTESCESDAQLAVTLSSASDELKSVLKIILEAPQEVMEVLRQEVTSSHPKQLFKAAVRKAGFEVSKAAMLAKELQRLLSR